MKKMKTRRKKTMSDRVASLEQAEAINVNEGNYLVSAGAGSGKTFVLTERVYRLVQEGTEFSKILVLTFTNKAAFEMKDRIRKKIENDSSLTAQKRSALISDCSGADICTFDSLFLNLVNKYHYDLGIDKPISIADESLIKSFLNQKLDEIFDWRFAAANEGKDLEFTNLIRKTCFDSTSSLKEGILSFYNGLSLQDDVIDYLDTYIEKYFSDEYVDRKLHDYVGLFREKVKLALPLAQWEDDIEQLSRLSLMADDEEFVKEFTTFKFKRWDAKQAEPLNINKEQREVMKAIVTPGFGARNSDVFGPNCHSLQELKDEYLAQKDLQKVCVEIVKELYEEVGNYQKENSIYTFDNVAYLARQLVKKEEIRESLKEKYKYILVDECQDTSSLQSSFLHQIDRGNSFYVGDIKQSIYRFRNADIDGFIKLRKEYEKGYGGTLKTLKDNYRSREEVIYSINGIFSKIMFSNIGGVNYASKEELLSKFEPYKATSSVENYGLHALIYSDDDFELAEGQKKVKIDQYREKEIELISKDIMTKVASGYQVTDSQTGLTRPCDYGDFAILLSTDSGKFDQYQKAFLKLGIPVEMTRDKPITEGELYIVMSNLCKALALDNLEKEEGKKIYAALARSFLFELPDQEIFDKINSGEYVNDSFFAYLTSKDNYLNRIPIQEAISELVKKFAIIEKMVSLSGAGQASMKECYAMVQSFYDLATSLSSLGLGMEEFVNHLSSLKAKKIEIQKAPPKVDANAIHLMTIHASKGLEFPVVYCPSLNRYFLRNIGLGDSSNSFARVLNQFLLSTLDANLRNNGCFIQRSAKELESQAERSEQMRLLYVALTRAKEDIILVYNKTKYEQKTNTIYDLKTHINFLAQAGIVPIDFKIDIPLPISKEDTKGSEMNIEFCEPKLAYATTSLSDHASKSSVHANKAALAFGDRLHKYMELLDFKTKDTSFIDNAKERAYIDKVLTMDVFSSVNQAKAYKEYAYFDEPLNSVGRIDLFFLYEGEKVVLIDYKAKNVDDPEYINQVNHYAKFLEESFDLPVEKYLLSIINASLKKVE